MTARLAFLHALLPRLAAETTLYVCLNIPPREGSAEGIWKQHSCSSVEQVCEVIEKHADHAEVYVSLAVFERGKRRKREFVVAKDSISVDMDDKAMPGETAGEKHANALKLANTVPAPKILLASGGGVHLHLRLREGDRVQDFDDRVNGVKHVERLAIALRVFLEAQARDLFGVEVSLDHTHTAERVWRVPWSFNCKAGDGAKILTADRTRWREVILMGHAEALAETPAADLLFLAPYVNDADAGAREATAEERTSVTFDVKLLPPSLLALWPMPTGDQSRHDFAIARALARAGHPPSVVAAAIRERRAQLPSGPDRDKGNREDYVARTVDNAFAAAGSRAAAAGHPAEPPLAWRLFPVRLLPTQCALYVRELSSAMCCDASYVVLPLLAALAGCVGNRRRALLKPGWAEPCIVWGVVVGKSGTIKSPVQHAVFGPLHADEIVEIKRHQEAMDVYSEALDQWKSADKKDRGEKPLKPEPPIRLVVSEITVEAIAERLEQNPLGLILVRDELAGWILSFDMYRKGHGGDVQKWIEMHGGRPMIVDRKSTEKKTICIARAAVSIAGGIQPAILRKALGGEHFLNGLASRLLMAAPRAPQKTWTDASVTPETAAAIARLFRELGLLECGVGEDGEAVPVDIPLSPAAKRIWIEFYNRHAGRQAEAPTDDLAAAFAKLEGYAARFALLFQLVSSVTTGQPDTQIEEKHMAAGIGVAEWFAHEEERVYAMLAEQTDERERRELVEIIRSRGGRATVRDLMHASRRYRARAEVAKSALDGLVAAGAGQWEAQPPGPKGGQPTVAFVLAPHWGSVTVTALEREEIEFGPEEDLA